MGKKQKCCYCCNPKLAKTKEKKSIIKQGWYAHYISDDTNCPYGVNYHTHGLVDSYDHYNIQIVLNIGPELSHTIVMCIVGKIKTGNIFVPDKHYFGIFDFDHAIKFIKIKENDRNLLRLIIHDKNGKVDIEEIEANFRNQYKYGV